MYSLMDPKFTEISFDRLNAGFASDVEFGKISSIILRAGLYKLLNTKIRTNTLKILKQNRICVMIE